MEQLEILKRKIESARELQSLVKTMKALAAVSIREYGQAVESLIEYNRIIEMGLQIVMRNRPREIEIVMPIQKNRLGAIIFGSEQGLCGKFNEQIAYYAIDRMNELKIKQELNFCVFHQNMRIQYLPKLFFITEFSHNPIPAFDG